MSRLLLLLALASCVQPLSNSNPSCELRCAESGMVFVGRVSSRDSGCICLVEKLPNCEAAWSRADVALSLLDGCQQALNACVARGSR